MEPSEESIAVRITRINSLILGNNNLNEVTALLTREGLLDTLQVLFDECNTDYLKNCDKNIKRFVEKNKKVLNDLKSLRVNLSDFEVKNVIGRGQFGEVHVVKEKQTGHIYAMKTIKKFKSLEENYTAFEEERNIMAFSTSPWLTFLQYAFQDGANLYFVMEYHPGGDLVGLLFRQGGTLPESAARFYIAELVLALHDLHAMGYVHRDIKPDNILLDRCGHVKIVDFGSSALLNSEGEMTEVIPVGTPDYIAPEILQSFDNKTKKTSYGTACDYWSLGVLAYELTVGSTPFNGQNMTSTYSKIINHANNLKFPSDIVLSQGFVALIRALLTDADRRLNYEGILKHPVYRNVDFNSLRDQVPPYVPKISSLDDTSNFIDVERKKNEPHIDSFKRKTQFSGKNLPFIGFTYTPFVDFKERFSSVVKDETVITLKKEMEKLQKQLVRNDFALEKESIEKKLDEKNRKLENVESVRNKLEKELAKTMAECSALRRTVELERKDRCELELKALEMIKLSKSKWADAEKVKLDGMQGEITKQKEIIVKLENENHNLKYQLEQVPKLENKHMVSLEKVENLRRSSVIGLENRLQKLTTQSQNELTEMQAKITNEIQKNSDLEKKVHNLKTTNSELKSQLAFMNERVEDLQGKLDKQQELFDAKGKQILKIEKYKRARDEYEAEKNALEQQIVQLQSERTNSESLEIKLRLQEDVNESFRQEIENLKTELNFEKVSNSNTVEELISKHKNEIRKLDAELREVLNKKTDIECKLKENQSNAENHKRKITSLENLVKQLETGVNQLESTSDKQTVLQKQVERLEQQLVETHEQFALEKQELSQLKTKYWRMERELQNATLDKKIIERDYKEAKDQNNHLTMEIDSLSSKISESKKSHELAFLELNGLNENLTNEVVKLSELIKNLEQKLHSEREKVDDEKTVIDDMKEMVNKKQNEIVELRAEVNTLKLEKSRCESHIIETNRTHENLNVQIERCLKERNCLLETIEDLKRKLSNSQQNQSALREACTLLENQLEEFERLYEVSENKRTSLVSEVEKLNVQLATERDNTQDGKKSANEEKSLRLLAETKNIKQTEEIENLQTELESYQKQCADFKAYSSSLATELTDAEQKITDLQIELKKSQRQVEDLISENFILKEENSAQLTYLSNLKESNYKLSQNLSEYKAVNKAIIEQVNSIGNVLSEKEIFYKEREIKTEATIKQQTKLIDYLQSKVEEGKKKKTLSDKLFGSSKKENQPPLSIVLNYRDLEQQLLKERETTKNLQQEIIRLKSEQYAGHPEKLKSSMSIKDQRKVLEQIVQSPQKNDLYRQNSVQRMQHNIPHRFESKLCTKSVNCGQCGDQLTIGRNSSICRECSIIVHTNCVRNVPRTCGLPQAFAKHFCDSLSKLENKDATSRTNDNVDNNIDLEGWVKIPVKSVWEKYYACLTRQTLTIYREPPNDSSPAVVERLEMNVADAYGKVTLEPVESEIGIPVASSDLPFVLKVEICPNTTCWPPKYIIFMTLSVEDKEKWYKALDNIFNHPTGKYCGLNIFTLNEEIDVNCLIEVDENVKLLGTDKGLYSLNSSINLLSHISGPLHVHQIGLIQKLNIAVLIVDENRVLITCDYKHLVNVAQCAPCSMPSLQFDVIKAKNMTGFHMFQTSLSKKDLLCAATARQIIIMHYDLGSREFKAEKILDTAEPTSFILFTEHSLLIGADKFFEIDLSNYNAEEFLDSSDRKLSTAIACYKKKSFPLAILQISKDPIEYLLCFHAFAVFVDEYGRSTRDSEIKWNHLPSALYLSHDFLYLVQFSAVEMIKIPTENESTSYESYRVELINPKYLGYSNKGIYVKSAKDLKYITSAEVDNSISIDTDSSEINEQNDSNNFSFTSSMVHSLDGHLSDNESDVGDTKKVKFARVTDL